MITNIESYSPILQSLIAGTFTYLITAIGALAVFVPMKSKSDLKKNDNKIVKGSPMQAIIGFAAGIMIAASYWSLLKPAIALAIELESPIWLVCGGGFLAGGLFLDITNVLISLNKKSRNKIIDSKKRAMMLMISITLHNIPEGLAIGVAFGGAALLLPGTSFIAAISLSIGIGLQNFPEGIAVAMPMFQSGMSRRKSFFFGQLSALVEPISAVIGAFLIILIRPLLPIALAFAAGAMIFCSTSSLIPQACNDEGIDLGTISLMTGFCIMMLMDVLL